MKREVAPLKVAVIGLGHLHPRSYMTLFKAVPDVRVTSVFEEDGTLREPFCQDFGIRGYDRLDRLLKAEQPDIAALFLPHVDCPDAAELCAAAGAHLMVEKPMASTRRGAERIVTAARRNKVQLTTGYCWRLHPVAQEIKRLISSGMIGEVVGGEGRCAAGRLTRYLDGKSPWILEKAKSGGGPMYNLGVHWIDLCRMILQDEVVEVSGRNVKINQEYDVEDNSFAHLRFKKGAIVALDISYTVPDAFPCGRDLYVAFRGTRGVISWSPAYEGQKDVLHVCSDDAAFAGSPRRSQEFELQPTPGYSGFMGLEYLRAFVRSVRTGKEPPISGQDGVEALRVVEAVYQSDSARRWVEIKR
ncbi:MAG: hypothetical protein A2498_08925 [Lentisphaerae bacterium RIFOXYC12_FULL_60_16]|nr:MAG: hypothetical protein A2498_08925 [Lentisphaerae bacterium RIFOXYC12_FULL_60_16]OGV81045.1 MAG: hypothetical protein A2340_07290 [Lentisphaerae bacterium RIFOXYB12_FULL_60_10]